MAKILTDNWHLYPPIQTLFERAGNLFKFNVLSRKQKMLFSVS